MSYRGVVGAVPYALRRSDSWLLRSYAVVGGLAALVVSLFVGLGLVVLMARTAGASGGAFTLSRAFYILLGLLIVAPLLAPILFVARRHRTDREVSRFYDAALGAAGYLFLAATYVGLVITVPPADQERVTGSLAPVVEFLYGLAPLWGLVPPVAAALLIYGVHRRLGGAWY